MKVVIDTNIWLMAIPKKSKYRPIFDALIQGKYQLYISNEILSEYLEIIEQRTNSVIANNFGEFLLNSRHVKKIDVYYRWQLIKADPDDNKFVDCAIAGNVKYIASNDKHFKELEKIDFPKLETINVDAFLDQVLKI